MANFSPQQKAFIGTYAKATGLHPGVVAAQVAAEEPVGASSGYRGTQNWLNVGITNSGPFGAANPAWHDPVKAAQLAAAWATGRTSIPGFGHAAPSIVNAIRSTAGQAPQAQIAALQRSGWASSGYPNLPSLFQTYGATNPTAPMGARGLPAAPGAAPQSVPVTTQHFDQAAFDKAQQAAVAGQFLAQSANGVSMWQTGPKSTVPAGANLFGPGLLTTTPPDRANYVTAQTTMQKLAGSTVLNAHPQLAKQPFGSAGGFLPQGAPYTQQRKDQGRDGQTTPGGAILANGNGHVVRVASDPGGFGPSYPIIHFTSGPYAGRTIYFGHTLATVKPGQSVQAGQTISHTGFGHGVGNATVPGWFEIGFADSGNPGPMGQAVPF